MSRILAIIILIAMYSTGTYAQKKKSAMRNNLKQMVVYEQRYDKPSEKAMKSSETMFDTDGNIVEEIEYENGKIKSHIKYEFDYEGNKIKEIELSSSGKPLKTIEYKYNDEGQKIKETEFNASGKPYKIVEYKYNGELKSEKIVFDGNNKMKSKKTYQYQTH